MHPEESRWPTFLKALGAAIVRFPVWTLVWLVTFLTAVGIGLPWQSWFDQTLAHAYEPGSQRAYLDAPFRFDHAPAMEQLSQSSAALAAPIAFLLMLFGAFTAGGWLQIFLQRTQGHSVRRFLWGGARYFWRFVRVWLITLAVLALITWLCHGWLWKNAVLELLFGATDGDLDLLVSERSALWLTWLQSGLYAFLVAMVLVWGDYTRTRLALQDTRSALWAGLCTLFLLILHPVRTLRPFFFLLLCELGLLFGLGTLSWHLNTRIDEATSWKRIIAIFAIGQAAILWQTIVRGARYFAAVEVSRALVPPLAQPDPWAGRIGGPGGPQYPISDDDDYGVSI